MLKNFNFTGQRQAPINKQTNVSSNPKDSDIESLELAQESLILHIPPDWRVPGLHLEHEEAFKNSRLGGI